MKLISKLNRFLCTVEGAIMVCWFAVVLFVMTGQVIFRYILNSPLTWSEEFARYSFVWISYLGCAYCVGVDGHTSITALRDKLPPMGQKLLIALGNLIVAGVFVRILPIAMKFIANNSRFLTSMMRIPFSYLYYSLVVGAVLTVVQLVLKSILLFDPERDAPDGQ